MSPLEHYIDGRFAAPHSQRLLDVIDPTTREVIGQVSDGDSRPRGAGAARRSAKHRSLVAPTAGFDTVESSLRGRMTTLRRP